MKRPDVSVVLNLHREAPFLRATLRSLDACALTAKSHGLRCELVTVFDRADALTLQVFERTTLHGFDSRRTVEVDVGSLGLARNAGIDVASGDYIWTADGDDLVSRNSIVELHRKASAFRAENCAIFINYLVAFGEQFHTGKYFPSSFFTIADFAYAHPYVSRIFLRRSVFDHSRYRDLPVTSGYAYEDWEFNARLRREGFQFLIAEDTVFFYRQRLGSLLRQADLASARIIPHSPLFDPEWFVRELSLERDKVGDWASFVEMRRQTCSRNFADEIIRSPTLRAELVEANRLDPEVDLTRIETSVSGSSVPWHADHWGFRLAEAFQLTGAGPYTDIVLLPNLNAGGAERYILHFLHALARLDVGSRFLVICGEVAGEHTWAGKLPTRSRLLDVYNAFPTLNDGDRDRLTVRLLLAVGARHARLHIKSGVFAHRLIDHYGSVLLDRFSGIYYRFSDTQFSWNGIHVTAPSYVRFLRRHLSALRRVVCDCDAIAIKDQDRLGYASNCYCVIRVPINEFEKPVTLPSHPRMRLLWASRVSKEKRPYLLAPLVSQLRNRWPELDIEIHGQADDGQDVKKLFDAAGLVYAGPYDGFESLPLDRFDAFIYTSAYDGMPNVVLEALAAGLPVIAPDVGGIREAVIDGQTGYLISNEAQDDALIDHYARAIQRLYENWASVAVMTEAARTLLRQQHDPAAFALRVAQAFELDERKPNPPDASKFAD